MNTTASPPILAGTQAQTLAASWSANAAAWTAAVRAGSIESRRLATDRAVVEAVLRRRPRAVLDLGCGEGWLVRALATEVATVVGMDVAPELIARAREAGGGTFHRAGYADLIENPRFLGRTFDVVVANFALLDDGLEPLLAALKHLLAPGGAVIVQTLHPAFVPPPYVDGWRQETFAGFGSAPGDQNAAKPGPAAAWTVMPWYFRTFSSWINALASVLRVARIEEPSHPRTGLPASLLITAETEDSAC